MSSRAFGAVLQGLQPIVIEAEVSHTDGIPHLVIIGLATHAVAEAKERITTALLSCNIKLQTKRTVVNLAPTDLKKSSPGLDVAIIVALLQQNRLFSQDISSCLFIGEVALDGHIKAVKGVLPIILQAKQLGVKAVFIPEENLPAVSPVTNVSFVPLKNVLQLVSFLKSNYQQAIFTANPSKTAKIAASKSESKKSLNHPFNSIIGHEVAKRALEIAVLGRHHVLLIGPPGSGKTKLAQAVAQLLPPLSLQEALESTAIHSVVQHQPELLSSRPFRSPHHSISSVGLLGGGNELTPGEISLAHHGVLFLDEITEFNRSALESLRQPIEQTQITITRAHGSVTYPSNFMLIAACNPCPCGYYGHPSKLCSCPESSRQRYFHKLSGPLLDRIDLILWIQPEDILSTKNEAQKYVGLGNLTQHNEKPSFTELKTLLEKPALLVLNQAQAKLQLSSRSVEKLVAVGHTISLVEASKTIQKKHVLEALQYRWRAD